MPEARTPVLRGPATRLAELTRTRWAIPAAIVILTAVSALIRVQSLHTHYWIDEGISVGIARHPLSQLPHLLKEDGSPPLYYALLHEWMTLFGRGEVATHTLSLIFALIAIPVAYWAGASLLDRRSGLICMVLIALVPFLTAYAQETRMYSLMVLLSLLCAASFVQLFVHRRRRCLPLFVVSLTAALYTHNWGLFLAVAAFVAFAGCAAAAQGEQRRALIRDGAIAFVAVLVLYAPWIPTLLYQAGHTGAPWALKPDIWSVTQGLYFIVGGRGAAVALLLGGGAGLLALHQAAGPRTPGRLAIYGLLVLGLGTLVLAWAEAKINPSWSPRYEAVIVGPLALVFAIGLARGGRLALAALALAACFWILDPVPTSLYSKSNVSAAAAAVQADLGANALVLSTQPEQVPTLAYYLPRVKHFGTPLGPVPDPGVVDWRGALERFRHSRERTTLIPMLRALMPGERVALVVETRLPDQPRYLALVNDASTAWARFLRHDRRLALIAAVSPHSNSSGVPVRIFVYRQLPRARAILGSCTSPRSVLPSSAFSVVCSRSASRLPTSIR